MAPTTPSSATAGPADRRWAVRIHREVAKTIAAHGGADSTYFQPFIVALLETLAVNPKVYPKKRGRLRQCRAAEIIAGSGVAWRLVFLVDEARHEVSVLSLGPHDRAYQEAARRA